MLAIALSGKKKQDEEDAPESEPDMGDMSAHDAAFDSFADAVGIPEEKRASAGAALKQYVRACMQEYGSGTEE